MLEARSCDHGTHVAQSDRVHRIALHEDAIPQSYLSNQSTRRIHSLVIFDSTTA